MPDPLEKANGRLKFLEGMRGVAALYVVLGHLCTMVDPAMLDGRNDSSPAWMHNFVSLFGFGHLAVAIFIVISGFSLQLSLFTRGDGLIHGLGRFFARRAKRILPTYYACLGFSVLVSLYVTPVLLARYGDPFSMYLPVDAAAIWTHILLIHNWWPSLMYRLNGVLWSIGIESQLYLVFPLLALGVCKLGRIPTLAVSAALAGGLLFWVPESVKLYPWYLPLFVLGMASSYCAFRPNLHKGVRPWSGLVIATISIGLGVNACRNDLFMPTSDACFGLGAAALMYAFAVAPNSIPARLIALTPLTFLGGFSYSMYLMHHPIEQAMYLLKPSTWSGPAALEFQFAFSLPAILLGTWLFSLVCERPFLNRQRAFPPTKAVVDASVRLAQPMTEAGAPSA